MWGTVFSHVCKCRCSDVNRVLLYMRVCVCELALSSWISRESRHLIATQHIVTHSPRYGTRSAHPALSFPFTLPFSRLLNFLLLLNMHFFAFYWNNSFFLSFGRVAIGNYTKLKIIAWPADTFATKFYFRFFFLLKQQKGKPWITLEWLTGLECFSWQFQDVLFHKGATFWHACLNVCVHVCREILFIFWSASPSFSIISVPRLF